MTVPSDPNLIRQPSTLDPTKEPPSEEAPLAMGHDDDRAGEVREVAEQVKADADQRAESDEPEVGPRAAGDHAGTSEQPETEDDKAAKPKARAEQHKGDKKS